MGEEADCHGNMVVFEEGMGNIKMIILYLVGAIGQVSIVQ